MTNNVDGDKLKEKEIENLITKNVDCDEPANQDQNFGKKKIQKLSSVHLSCKSWGCEIKQPLLNCVH